jgi:hypothetical protein
MPIYLEKSPLKSVLVQQHITIPSPPQIKMMVVSVTADSAPHIHRPHFRGNCLTEYSKHHHNITYLGILEWLVQKFILPYPVLMLFMGASLSEAHLCLVF